MMHCWINRRLPILALLPTLLLGVPEAVIAQTLTDWDRDGLNGKVRSVSWYMARFTNRNGAPMEGDRSHMYDWDYDRNGTGVHTGPVRLIGCSLFPHTTVTSHHKDMNRIETTYSDSPTAAFRSRGKSVRKYDWMGRLISTRSYDFTGTLEFETVYSYDWRNRLLERSTRNSEGNLRYRINLSYNADGTDRDFRSYDALGEVYQIDYFYQFDGHGNWIKQTAMRSITKSGKLIESPDYAVYRSISYYDER